MFEHFPKEIWSEGASNVWPGARTCVHEAGHAVMAYLNVMPFKSLHFTPTKRETKGRLVIPGAQRWVEDGREKMEAYVLTVLAGEAAQAIVTQTPPEKLFVYAGTIGYGDDWKKAMVVAYPYCHSDTAETSSFLIYMRLRCRNILSQPETWRAVEVVSEHLFDAHRLGVRRVKTLIQQAMQGQTPTTGNPWWTLHMGKEAAE